MNKAVAVVGIAAGVGVLAYGAWYVVGDARIRALLGGEDAWWKRAINHARGLESVPPSNANGPSTFHVFPRRGSQSPAPYTDERAVQTPVRGWHSGAINAHA